MGTNKSMDQSSFLLTTFEDSADLEKPLGLSWKVDCHSDSCRIEEYKKRIDRKMYTTCKIAKNSQPRQTGTPAPATLACRFTLLKSIAMQTDIA